jgi:hypothetical protein
VRACACVCVRACVCGCVGACVCGTCACVYNIYMYNTIHTYTHTHTNTQRGILGGERRSNASARGFRVRSPQPMYFCMPILTSLSGFFFKTLGPLSLSLLRARSLSRSRSRWMFFRDVFFSENGLAVLEIGLALALSLALLPSPLHSPCYPSLALNPTP